MDDELLKWWEDRATHIEQEWKRVYGDNQTLGPLVYLRDVVPYKHILRNARLRAERPICWGATDCLEKPIQQCRAGKHDVCIQHGDDCFVCKAENESPKS